MLLENIRRLCAERGTTLWSIERELGIGNGVIARWANGDPRIGNVEKVAAYFGVTVDELLRSDDAGGEVSE